MCGRSRFAMAPARVAEATGVPPEQWQDAERYQPRFNASPGSWLPILRRDQASGGRMLHTMRWGLVPSFTRSDGSEKRPDDPWKMFNARSESVAEKPVFSRLLASRRCVVPLEGFYEWRMEGGKKQPYYVTFRGGQLMFAAGLWDVWKGPSGLLHTYTILTTESSPKLAWLHDRMPVFLTSDEALEAWLGAGPAPGPGPGPGSGEQEASQGEGVKQRGAPVQLCGPCNSEALVWWPVSAQINKGDYEGPDASADVRKSKGSLTALFAKQAAKSPPKPPAQPPVVPAPGMFHAAGAPAAASPAKPAAKPTAKPGLVSPRKGGARQPHSSGAKPGSLAQLWASKGGASQEAADAAGPERNADKQAGPSQQQQQQAAADEAAAAAGPQASPGKRGAGNSPSNSGAKRARLAQAAEARVAAGAEARVAPTADAVAAEPAGPVELPDSG